MNELQPASWTSVGVGTQQCMQMSTRPIYRTYLDELLNISLQEAYFSLAAGRRQLLVLYKQAGPLCFTA